MKPVGNLPKADWRPDAVFAALGDATRRALLARLAKGEASVAELAAPFAMTQPAVSKHLKVLESAGLVVRSKDAQRHLSRLNAAPLADAAQWLADYAGWTSASRKQTDAPDGLKTKKKKDKKHKHKKH